MDDLYGYASVDDGIPTGEPEPQHTEAPASSPAEAFNAVANAVTNPIGAAAEILSPENVERAGIPLAWAVVGLCVIAVIWVASFSEKD